MFGTSRQIRVIERVLSETRKEVRGIMQTLQDLTNVIAKVTEDVQKMSDDVKAAIAKIGQLGSGPDVQAQVDALTAVSSSLEAASSELNAAVNPPAPEPAP